MKRLTTKLMVAAAAFMAVAGVASAQSLQANIPFAFRANGKVMAPGTYRITMSRSATALVRIQEKFTGEQALGLAAGSATPKAEWTKTGEAVLSFECGIGRCSLTKIYTGEPGEPAYRLSAPGFGKDEPRQTAEIVMHRVAD